MARIRTIKPDFFTSEDIVGLTPLARLFYVALWCESDREGRMEWKPGTFKMRYFPGDQCDIESMTSELVKRGLIVQYQFAGKHYAEIPTFTEHQVINNREASSTLPAREVNASRTRAPRVKAEGKGREGKEGREDAAFSAGFAEFWKTWPAGDRKHDRKACWEKWQLHDLEDVSALILSDVAMKKESEKWKGGFVEAPGVYINNRRWEDRLTLAGAVDASGWRETRRGVETRAAALGLPKWDETEQFAIYRMRVMHADQSGAPLQ